MSFSGDRRETLLRSLGTRLDRVHGRRTHRDPVVPSRAGSEGPGQTGFQEVKWESSDCYRNEDPTVYKVHVRDGAWT